MYTINLYYNLILTLVIVVIMVHYIYSALKQSDKQSRLRSIVLIMLFFLYVLYYSSYASIVQTQYTIVKCLLYASALGAFMLATYALIENIFLKTLYLLLSIWILASTVVPALCNNSELLREKEIYIYLEIGEVIGRKGLYRFSKGVADQNKTIKFMNTLNKLDEDMLIEENMQYYYQRAMEIRQGHRGR